MGPTCPHNFWTDRASGVGLVRIVTDRQTDGRRAGAPYAGTFRACYTRVLYSSRMRIFNTSTPLAALGGWINMKSQEVGVLRMYFDTRAVILRATEDYSWQSMIGEIGGYASLLLGTAVIDLVGNSNVS